MDDTEATATSLTCGECAQPVVVGDRFCEACGAEVGVRQGETEPGLPVCPGGDRIAGEEEFCPHCGLRTRTALDRVEIDLGPLAGVSDRGHAHAFNEDAMALGSRQGLGRMAAVSDGVSSSRTSECAARAAASTALEVLLAAGDKAGGDSVGRETGRPTDAGSVGRQSLRAAMQAAIEAVAAEGSGEFDDPACTLVAAFVGECGEIDIGWVGDSRAYWLAETGSRRLTRDHSWAAELLDPDVDEATLLADRRAHVLTRWLGPIDEAPPEPGFVEFHPDGPGVLLLCTDGLWNYLPEPVELAELALAPGTPAERAAALTRYALDAGGRDNITVVLLPISPEAES
ncbi:serine/threonine protein phosphatase PrpC [Pseudonocardia eucalypti]|uniref:protein phosphatase 2C domain-containing protein n=1 Tax=Pseudonocardia eucalypti TaxID=648755 RepID=UPI00160EADEA|nr:serine/threonine protein phosphatase PrpC [Pseudonocardia eucalypti]